MLGDQVSVQAPGQQRPGVAVGTHEVGIRPSPVQGDLAEVADARGQLQPDQVEQGEVDQGHAVGIGRVLGDRHVGGIAEDLVQHIVRLTVGGDDHLRAERRVLVVDMGVRTQPFVGEVARQGARRQRLALGHWR